MPILIIISQEHIMNIEEWRPEPRPSLPPPRPVRKWRSALINMLIFTGAFVVCLAVLGRHEIAGYFEHSAESPPTRAGATATRPLQDIAVASGVVSPPNSDQAAIRSLPAEPGGQTSRRPRQLPASTPIRLPEANPPMVDRPLP
jgi:hypothetical protein